MAFGKGKGKKVPTEEEDPNKPSYDKAWEYFREQTLPRCVPRRRGRPPTRRAPRDAPPKRAPGHSWRRANRGRARAAARALERQRKQTQSLQAAAAAAARRPHNAHRSPRRPPPPLRYKKSEDGNWNRAQAGEGELYPACCAPLEAFRDFGIGLALYLSTRLSLGVVFMVRRVLPRLRP